MSEPEKKLVTVELMALGVMRQRIEIVVPIEATEEEIEEKAQAGMHDRTWEYIGLTEDPVIVVMKAWEPIV